MIVRGFGGGARPLHLEQRLAVVRAERELPGQHLEEEDAERVEIALRGRLFAARLLGRHVLRRSEDGPLRGEARVHREVGEPEVEDLDEVLPPAARAEEDVVALQVAVNDAEVVRAGERGAHLLEDIDAARERHRSARQLARERHADEVLHDEVELALFGLTDVVDVDDVRVVDAVGGARFAQHPGAQVGLAAQVRADELERDDAVDEHVTGAIDDAHPALADARFQPVPPGDDATQHRVYRLGRLGNSVCALHSPPLHSLIQITQSAHGW